MTKEPWNGDLSLLREDHITAMIIDFEERTVEVYADNQFRDQTGGHYELVEKPLPFANVSPFGQIARGLRRMMSNHLNEDARRN